MKMVKVRHQSGEEILACHVDLPYFEAIGWKVVQAKPAPRAKVVKEEQE